MPPKKHSDSSQPADNTSGNNQGNPRRATKRIAKRAGINAKRQRKVIRAVASGVSTGKAMIDAGYSPYYAHSEAHKFLQRPLVKSLFTEEIKKALEAKGKVFGAMVTPYIDALDAPIIVKSATEGIACIARDPETQEILPDHRTRMDAADRLIALHGGVPKDSEMPPPPQPGMNIIIMRDQAKVQINQSGITQAQAAKVEPTGDATDAGMPSVTIRKG